MTRRQDDCKTRMDINIRTTKQRTLTDSQNGSNNKQQVNNNRTTALEWTAALATGGLKCILLFQIFALDSSVVEVQEKSFIFMSVEFQRDLG